MSWMNFLMHSYASLMSPVYMQMYPIMKASQPSKMLSTHIPLDLPHNFNIVEQLMLVLTNNYFEFSGAHYKVSGKAIGTKLLLSYTNLSMTKFEEKHVYTYPLQPTLLKRFINIFLMWHSGLEFLQELFIYDLNIVHSIIKFTNEIPHQTPFLDHLIYIKELKWSTKLLTSQLTGICIWTITQDSHQAWENQYPILNF